MGDYYDRTPVTHLDGSPIFKTAGDEANEQHVAALIEAQWGCTLHSFGRLAPVDWYAIRDDRIVGVLELKSRTHPHDQYPTVFLNVRKWLALELASIGLGVPAVFVVKFTDAVLWTADMTGSTRVAGCARIVKSRNDREPVIDVPVASMRRLTLASHERAA